MIINIISNQPIKYLTLYQKSNDDDFGAKIQTKQNRNLKHAKSRGKATLKAGKGGTLVDQLGNNQEGGYN